MAEFPTYEQMAKNVAEKALDEYLIEGKTLREWIKIIAEQEPKTGHWIRGKYSDDDLRYNNTSYKCDKCGKVADFRENFCPNCGAKMSEIPTNSESEDKECFDDGNRWISVSERLPELNKPLLVTAYHRVCYAHMISESGNYGYPVFRLHEIKDSGRGWVQETISHEPYSKGRIDAWMYIDIPEPYKVEPQERSDKE